MIIFVDFDGVESYSKCWSTYHGWYRSCRTDNILSPLCDVFITRIGPQLPPVIPIADLFQGGKSHFGYVYGFILLGTVSLHFILNLMSQIGVNFIRTASVLGYCLLPLVLISAVGVVLSLEYVPIFGIVWWGSGFLGYSLAAVAISWCTYSASAIFVAVLQLTEMRALVAYPVGLFCIPPRPSLSIFLHY
jgi:hypothetical protein